jgi:aspartate-semialdehyde dehydrogenase
MKMALETKKIMRDEKIKVSATCVRIPVYRAHSEAVWIETEKKANPDEVRKLLRKADGVVVVDDITQNKYPMPIDAENKLDTFVGRIREDISIKNGLTMWVVSDNLLKGAAWNAVQIAEVLIQRKLV